MPAWKYALYGYLALQVPQFLYVAWAIVNPSVGRTWANYHPEVRDGTKGEVVDWY